ncbi:MAG: transcription-repair coupling factor [Clostridia bacterium]|nr:transcription-repair coupling factor [Clostridia bacterium]
MKRLTSLIRQDREFSASMEALAGEFLKKEPLPIVINGLSGGASSAYLVESVFEAGRISGVPSLIICGSEAERERVFALLSSGGIKARQYKPRDFVFYNISASHDTERERLSVLSDIIYSDCDAIVTTLSAALLYTMPPSLLASLSVRLSVGDIISPENLSEKLTALGFKNVELVDGAGQFSRRGGIVDVWHKSESNPVRIEFFGDEIDRMVYFNPITQRSSESCDVIELIPATEVIIDTDAGVRVKKAIETQKKKAKTPESDSKLKEELVLLMAGAEACFKDKYISLIYPARETLFSYFKKKTALFVLGTNEVKEEYKRAYDVIAAQRAAIIDNGLIAEKDAEYIAAYESFTAFLSASPSIHINPFSGGMSFGKLAGLFGFRSRRTVSYGGNLSMLFEDLKNYRKALYKTLVLAPNKQGAESLISTLLAEDIAVSAIYDSPDFDIEKAHSGGIFVDVGTCDGYELIVPKLAVLSMAEDEGKAIMANRRRQRILKKSGGAGQRIMSYAELTVGDYVVHANYGIGLFEGMETIRVDGASRDYITIRYAGTDKLFVPCDRLDYIGKYIGERDADGKVKLSKMGGDFARVKARAKKSAQDIAEKLIKLYAERQRKPGIAFPLDSELEDEFAASFDYEETASQLAAIEEIKRDMIRPVPMNRLLCGDVGYGKTEVALRAAFKAIMGGYQVAILVPTTILALQHFETASARMRNYPVTVEMISRFRTPKQQADILKRVRQGSIDILIGTHKLLSKQLEFRNLGLLIVDEEQRFGVAQKERLKEIAGNVDVLTLTATPIPRTLNMAMNGISDMSVLDEAPGDRRPVQTYVLEYDDGIIFDAINRELLRGGQVLYLYNKVSDIAFAAGKIEKAFPSARVAYAHGQMEKDELEDIWQLLVRGDIDVLVCTSIIETGVDLPNANTLIIENADRMGLSQLHQLRGRVGRSERQAYAYFTYRQGKALSEVATKRLKAIREFAEFGAGFKVALCDLEIRGAGNLLGAEQHGYIESVGYDLFLKLLNEAIIEERGEKIEETVDATVDIKADAYIPESYVRSSSRRIEMYKKISQIETEDDKSDVLDELCDRFGEPPRSVVRLIDIVNLRLLASRALVNKVSLSDGTLTFSSEKFYLEALGELFVKYRGLGFKRGSAKDVSYKLPQGKDAVDAALAIMTDYYNIIKEMKETNAENKNS